MKITKSQLKQIIKEELGEALEDRINPDADDLEQAGFRPDPEEVARSLAQAYPDLADGRVTKKIGKNDLMMFIVQEYDVSEQTAMQVVEELIQEGFIGMFTDFVNIINADFDEDYDDYEDDAYAMASAGFGTDEDYGFYGESIERKNKIKITKSKLKQIISEELAEVINEKKKSGGKKDACYYKVKSRYKVWPSAYASGALVKCRKVGAKNWGTGGKKNEDIELQEVEDALEPQIRQVLKDEGGAAGLDAIVKAVGKDEDEVKIMLDAMVDVGEHVNGDYILDDEAEVDIEKK